MPVNPMRVALWATQLLAVFFLVRTVMIGEGWWLTTDPVADHVKSAFIALLASLASHVGTVFYVIGSRKILRSARAELGFDPDPMLFRQNDRALSWAGPAAAAGSLSLVVGFILGGAADTGAISFALHGVLASLAVLVNLVCLALEAKATQHNHLILKQLRAEEVQRRDARASITT